MRNQTPTEIKRKQYADDNKKTLRWKRKKSKKGRHNIKK
jgi:hypothetical protein